MVAALALPALAQQGGSRTGKDQEDYYKYMWNGLEDRYGDTESWDTFEKLYEDGFEKRGFSAFRDDFEGEDFFFGDDRNALTRGLTRYVIPSCLFSSSGSVVGLWQA